MVIDQADKPSGLNRTDPQIAAQQLPPRCLLANHDAQTAPVFDRKHPEISYSSGRRRSRKLEVGSDGAVVVTGVPLDVFPVKSFDRGICFPVRSHPGRTLVEEQLSPTPVDNRYRSDKCRRSVGSFKGQLTSPSPTALVGCFHRNALLIARRLRPPLPDQAASGHYQRNDGSPSLKPVSDGWCVHGATYSRVGVMGETND